MSLDSGSGAHPEVSSKATPPALLRVFGGVKKALGKAFFGQKEVSHLTEAEERERLIEQFQSLQGSIFWEDAGVLARAISTMGISARDLFDVKDSTMNFFSIRDEARDRDIEVQIWNLARTDGAHFGPTMAELKDLFPQDTLIVCKAHDAGKPAMTPEGSLMPANAWPGMINAIWLFVKVANDYEPFLLLKQSSLSQFLEGLAQLDVRKQQVPALTA